LETLPELTEEEVYSSYVKSKFGISSTEAMEMGVQLPMVMGYEYEDTSLYLIGNVSVGLIFVQAPSEGEMWPEENISKVSDDIKKGLRWLSDQEPRSEVYNWRRKLENVSIPAKPTECPWGDRYSCWIYPTLGELDCVSDLESCSGIKKCSANSDGFYEYVNYLRKCWGQTDWAFMIFIVIGDNFDGGIISWSTEHGPYFAMTEGLGGESQLNWWNTDLTHLRRNVTAHETAHIFGAWDEYYENCNCVFFYGYDNIKVPNLMCEAGCFPGDERGCVECVWGNEGDDCTDNSDCNEEIEFCEQYSGSSAYHKCRHKCIMVGALPRICNSSRAQIGWRDCDNDNILDPIDTDGICDPVQDSDGVGPDSKDYTEKGTCSGGCDLTTWSCNGGKTDYCIDDYTLAEYYVSDKSDGCIQIRKNCTEIGSDYFCYDGRCTQCIGDLDGDRGVDILDLIIVAIAYGSTPVDPNWDERADLNNDGQVDLLDLIAVATHYGESCV